MKKNYFFSCALFFCAFSPALSNAQDSTIQFQHYDLKSGLLNNTIYEMVIENNGFLWFTTQNGIIRYDGVEFDQFLVSEKDGVIKSDLPDQILLDKNGGVWVGYQLNHYIAHYDALAGDFIFRDMHEEVDVPGGIQHTRLLGIDQKNRLWVALMRFENPEEPWVMTIDSDSGEILKLYVDDEGNSLFEEGYFIRTQFGTMGLSPFLSTDKGVWLGASNGLYFVDNEDTIRSYRNHPLDESQKFAQYQVDLINDEIWSSSPRGVHKFDEDENRFIPVNLFPEDVFEAPVYKSYQDEGGDIWLTSMNGSYRVVNGVPEYLSDRKEFADGPKVVLYPEVEDDQYIWFVNKSVVTSSNITDGIVRYDKKSDLFTIHKADADNEQSIKSNEQITLIRKASDGTIWVGDLYEGLSIYKPDAQKFTNIMADPEIKEQMGNQFYYSMEETPEGLFFLGTTNGRIFVHDPEQNRSFLFHNFGGERADIIYDLHYEKSGTLWVVVLSTGLHRFTFNPDTFEIENVDFWEPRSGDDGFDAFRPTTLIEGDDNNLWIGTAGGVAEYLYDEGRFISYDSDDESFHPRSAYGGRSMKSSDGEIWFFGENSFGLKSINPTTKETTAYNLRGEVPDEHVFEFGLVVHVFEDQDGNILAAEDGVFILKEGKFRPVIDGFTIPVTQVLQHQNGDYILSTYGRGVYWFDLDGTIQKQLDRNSGLTNDTISDIKIDRNGNLWILHSLGMSVYDYVNDRVVNYDESHGLTGALATNSYKLLETRSGYLAPVFLANDLSIFDPTQFTVDEYNAFIKFISVTAGKESLPVQAGSGVSIPHNYGELQFSFSSPRFSNADMQEYRYRLNGSDVDWSSWSTNRQVQFAGLQPGSYNLQIETRNSDRVVSPAVGKYVFTIIPPWHQTTMARILFLLIGFGLMGFTAIRYSNYRTRQINIGLQAEQADELAKLDRVKTNLLTNISHELRTPLTLVMGPIEQLYNQSKSLGEDWQQKLQVARRNGKRLSELVEQVLDLTRLESKQLELNPKRVDVNAFLKRTVESFGSLAERKNLSVSISLPDYDVQTDLDPDKFEKIVVNLLSNAMKFTPEKGTVTLSLRESDDHILIQVTDSGRGIEPDRLSHIFDRFHSTGEPNTGGGKGLGVGLAITKEFVNLHDGEIRVESTVGEGTTFIVVIPRKLSAVETDVYQNDSITEVESDHQNLTPVYKENENKIYTILLVEDNEDMREYISGLISDKSIHVEIAENGLQGKKQMALVKPDLIITDIMMPKMDGFEFTEYVRSVPEYRLTPVVMLSARAEVEDRIQGYQAGISDYLIKPFNQQELKARVKNLLMLKIEREKKLSEAGPVDEEPSREVAFVQELREFVEKNLSQSEITVEELGDAANVSRSQLYRNLKTSTGYTPAEFVKEIRLNSARTILERKQRSTISEVAYDVGFSTPSYFSRLYKKRFGRSPGDYLK